ncbi:MAG: DUF2937 family protein [Paraglaciecola sp.]|uniref:DUF2937 family protein n=1 Tax=Paraglaciecola sp. TaxID=1920173 RepID=UPI003299CB00
MIKFCLDYLRLILFCSGLLMGIQIPAVVDQYEKRVDARLSEALDIFAGFQQTADRYFGGNVEDLVKHYESSEDVVFNDDARNIRFISDRVATLQQETQSLQQQALWRVLHVVTSADKQIINETMEQYSYMILIDPQALIWGIVCGFLITIGLEALLHFFGFCLLCFRPHKHRTNN